MPLLDEESLKKMCEAPPKPCSECGAETYKNYCRTCDVFFREGHKQDCSLHEAVHENHRTY